MSLSWSASVKKKNREKKTGFYVNSALYTITGGFIHYSSEQRVEGEIKDVVGSMPRTAIKSLEIFKTRLEGRDRGGVTII